MGARRESVYREGQVQGQSVRPGGGSIGLPPTTRQRQQSAQPPESGGHGEVKRPVRVRAGSETGPRPEK